MDAEANPVTRYHERSKHHPQHYAAGPDGLDWASQPDPFRRYAGAPSIQLPVLAGELPIAWDALSRPGLIPPQAFNLNNLAALLQLSLGISAWKSYGDKRWALRCNPSSGNLHPTEAYVICPELPDLAAGVYHYAPREHALESRSSAPFTWQGGAFVALSGIHWREAWKYGIRAFRYCQHDCGHAVAALAYAAALLGWTLRRQPHWSDTQIASLCGLDRPADFTGAETEVPEVLLWLGPGESPSPTAALATLQGAGWRGQANALSPSHREWTEIPAIAAATESPGTDTHPDAYTAISQTPLPPLAPTSDLPASRLIRQRRSAQAFDGETALPAAAFFRLLDALLPRPGVAPWSAMATAPAVHPVFFVHRVNDLAPGIYCLPRCLEARLELQREMRLDWLWQRVATAPAHLPLYLLAPLDTRDFAASVACHQEIAADSAFSLAMLARFDDIAAAPWRYRQRFWEAGMLGQVLYLEAEAAGVQGTGIGCYFDNAAHQSLGLTSSRYQDIYHFTVGRALVDTRLSTETPYPTGKQKQNR